ncbi:Adenine phosphoribosyltransferase 1 [Chlorella vulgaris]
MHVGAVRQGQRVLLVDDLIATGGTLRAGVELVQKAGGKVVEAACIIELPELKGREKLEGLPLFVLVEKEGLRGCSVFGSRSAQVSGWAKSVDS